MSAGSSTASAPLKPTTRSRTLLFFSYRDSSARPRRRSRPGNFHHYTDNDNDNNDDNDDEHAGLINGASSSYAPPIPQPSLPPKWVDISEQVDLILAGTQSKIQALDKLHAKHLLPGFTDRSAEEREIQAAATDITRDFRQCHALVQRITASAPSTHTFPPVPPSSNETRAAQNVQRAMAAKVQELSGTFRKKQRVYMERLQGHAIKNQDILVASGAVRLKGSEGITALEEDMQASQQTQAQTQAQLTSAPDLVAARTTEIDSLARSIASLAELFKDLSNLVIDQGTLLDSVEWNVEMAAQRVEGAAKELVQAEKYQKSTGRRQCIFLLMLIILGLILVLIFKPKRHSVPSPPSVTQYQTTSSSEPKNTEPVLRWTRTRTLII